MTRPNPSVCDGVELWLGDAVEVISDDTVFDPFMGSGSTIIAALLEGRKAVGIEIDERYFNIACERVERLLPLLDTLQNA